MKMMFNQNKTKMATFGRQKSKSKNHFFFSGKPFMVIVDDDQLHLAYGITTTKKSIHFDCANMEHPHPFEWQIGNNDNN